MDEVEVNLWINADFRVNTLDEQLALSSSSLLPVLIPVNISFSLFLYGTNNIEKWWWRRLNRIVFFKCCWMKNTKASAQSTPYQKTQLFDESPTLYSQIGSESETKKSPYRESVLCNPGFAIAIIYRLMSALSLSHSRMVFKRFGDGMGSGLTNYARTFWRFAIFTTSSADPWNFAFIVGDARGHESSI